MYTNLSYDLAMAKQREMQVRGENQRRARQAMALASTAKPSASHRGRRALRLATRLRPQIQS